MDGVAAQNQGWFAYSVLLVVAGVAVLVPFVISQGARLFGKKNKSAHLNREPRAKPLGKDDFAVSQSSSVNTRYFTAIQLGALLTGPLFLLVPLAIPQNGRWFSSASVVTLCITAGVALIYANRKGDLRWIGSIRPSDKQGNPDSRGNEL